MDKRFAVVRVTPHEDQNDDIFVAGGMKEEEAKRVARLLADEDKRELGDDLDYRYLVAEQVKEDVPPHTEEDFERSMAREYESELRRGIKRQTKEENEKIEKMELLTEETWSKIKKLEDTVEYCNKSIADSYAKLERLKALEDWIDECNQGR